MFSLAADLVKVSSGSNVHVKYTQQGASRVSYYNNNKHGRLQTEIVPLLQNGPLKDGPKVPRPKSIDPQP